MTSQYKHLFGPVHSRRLGTSLGIDLVPLKTCSLDCIYCECGATTHLTIERKPYFPVNNILRELKAFLSQNPPLDYLTFSGSGEPTLHSEIGQIINFIKTEFPDYALALLTNSTLMHLPEVRTAVRPIDLILPSFDAATDRLFQKINRPHSGVTVDMIRNGLTVFQQDYPGTMWLEIFISEGLNDTQEELAALKSAVHQIKPNLVQINSLDRQGTHLHLKAADRIKLEKIAAFLEWPADVIARTSTVAAAM
ncbi:radical SAM protein [bacterium]|nr:radical SAM protein [bacterium]